MRDESFADLIAPYDRVALVLQGGGALGAYQAGVLEGLFKHDIHPTWVAGVSIGAINAALIAGNPPERRCTALSEFWSRIAPPSPWEGAEALWRRLDPDGPSIAVLNQWSAWRTALSGQPGFFRPRAAVEWAAAGPFAGPTSFYDTAPLKKTLEDLIDFDRINRGDIRLSLGAVDVQTGNSIYFDTETHRIGPEHVMASGALPPGFAPVEIDGGHYWDGGLVSNTPLDHVLEDQPRRDTLVFQVDLWSATARCPAGCRRCWSGRRTSPIPAAPASTPTRSPTNRPCATSSSRCSTGCPTICGTRRRRGRCGGPPAGRRSTSST
ncbi:patatin-like phospholipase family protein [Azospirillum sp. B506]|uniref:patatin-like phospholipase family protein n=1 Tax=Azospirillum sp. B506 TaxID=137721 RepID=UPI000344F603|nr:patatin-like phospholipase family protein [Azospirillum sp. B506]